MILEAEEKQVINVYREIYNQGIEPRVFINDFLELLYYFKNINLITLESTNFSLNDEEFARIKKIAEQVSSHTFIMFWQFTIKTLEEIEIVSNQNLSIEMFLMRLMHLVSLKPPQNEDVKNNVKKDINSNYTIETIDQIKNVSQEKKVKIQTQPEIKAENIKSVNSFDQLLQICSEKKEIKLKYELEKNVNLVSFEKNRIEISFNDNLDKNFLKDLSLKLFEWTNERWIITLTKTKGEISVKEKELNLKNSLIEKSKESKAYKSVLEKFPDASLINATPKKNFD